MTYAIVQCKPETLAAMEKSANNHTTAPISFYANENRVSVNGIYSNLSHKTQVEILAAFLQGFDYEIKTISPAQ